MPTSSEHPGSPKSSNPSSPVDSYEKSGPYGPYNTPILPPSAEMRAIVGDAMSMAGGVAAVLLQIAQPGVGAGVAANSSFTVRPVERGSSFLVHAACSLHLSFIICQWKSEIECLLTLTDACRPSVNYLYLRPSLRHRRGEEIYH